MLNGLEGYTLEEFENVVVFLVSSVSIHHALDELERNLVGYESKKP
jgi:hypothetical protein